MNLLNILLQAPQPLAPSGAIQFPTIIFIIFLLVIVTVVSRWYKKYENESESRRIAKSSDAEKVYEYFEPERRRLQLQMQQEQGTGINSGKVIGGVAKGTFKTAGWMVSVIPGGGIAKAALDGLGNLADKGIQAGANALDRPTAEFQNIDRKISDTELDEILKKRVINLDLMKKGFDSLMLDETQITELPPICLDNYYLDENNENLFVVRGKDGIYRTTCYQVNCLYFTKKQLCIYQCALDLSNGIKLRGGHTKEYFWKDITEFSFKTLDAMGKGQKCFVISTSGGEYVCVYKESPETNRALQGMKSYFRDVKENA